MKAKLLAIIIVILAGAGTFMFLLSSKLKKQEEYEGYIAVAREQASLDVPYIAISNYKKAFKIKTPDEELYREYVEQCKILEDDAYYEAVKKYVDMFPKSSYGYEKLCEYYYDNQNYSQFFPLATKANELGVATEKVGEMYIECRYLYKTIKANLEEAHNFPSEYAKIKYKGSFGFVNGDGGMEIPADYDDASEVMNGYASVCKDGVWFMINSDDYKIAAVRGTVDFLSFLSNGLLLASKDGKWGYLNSNLVVPESFPFDEATNFKNQVAAVRKGDKWAIIKADGSSVTDYIFDDIVRDEFNACIDGGIIIAKKGEKYDFYDAEGTQLTNIGFDEVFPFMGDGATAFRKGDKWGFVDKQGNVVIEPQYEEAKCFNIGLAPVKIDGKWGYINTSNVLRIENIFEDAGFFNGNGVAAINDGESWCYIKLYLYCYM